MKADVLKSSVDRLAAELKACHRAREAQQESSRQTVQQRLLHEIQREPSLREAIDEACRVWLSGGSWPKMSEHVAAVLVWERLNEGYLLGGNLWHQGFRVEQKSENDVLLYLLVDSWAANGVFRLRARLNALP